MSLKSFFCSLIFIKLFPTAFTANDRLLSNGISHIFILPYNFRCFCVALCFSMFFSHSIRLIAIVPLLVNTPHFDHKIFELYFSRKQPQKMTIMF